MLKKWKKWQVYFLTKRLKEMVVTLVEYCRPCAVNQDRKSLGFSITILKVKPLDVKSRTQRLIEKMAKDLKYSLISYYCP